MLLQHTHLLYLYVSKSSFCFSHFVPKNIFCVYSHRKRRRNVRDRHTKPVQLNFRGKQSTLKVDDFLDFRENFTTGSAPRGIRSTSLLLALRSSRRPRRPRGAAPAVPDDQTHVPTCPQCSLMITQWSGGAYGGPGGPYLPQLSKFYFLLDLFFLC